MYNKRTRSGSTVRGLNPGVGETFCTRPDRPWDPPSLLYNGYPVSFLAAKRQGRGVNHPHPSSAEVTERVELYLYSPSGPSWHALGWNLYNKSSKSRVGTKHNNNKIRSDPSSCSGCGKGSILTTSRHCLIAWVLKEFLKDADSERSTFSEKSLSQCTSSSSSSTAHWDRRWW